MDIVKSTNDEVLKSEIILPNYLLAALLCFTLQVHSFQRKALQVSGVWEGLLPVQDPGCPQNITHAGQGIEASKDQVIHSASREGTGTLEKHNQRQ